MTISGSYSGDSAHSTSSGSAALAVSAPAPHPTSTAVSPNPSSVFTVGTITFTTTVTDTGSSPTAPSGTISWTDGGAGGSFSSPTCALQGAGAATSSCQVTYTASSTAGSVTITASYSGDSAHSTSSGASSLSVAAATSTLTVTTQDTTGATLTGYYTVLFQNNQVVSNGYTPATFTLNNGQTYAVQVDGYGSCSFGHWLDTGSTTNPRAISITSATSLTAVMSCSHPTATTVSPNPASVTVGGALTFTATVTDTGSSPSSPSGTISWSDGGAGGSFSATTCTLSSSGTGASTCQAAYTAPSTAGSVTITGTYSGDSTHATSSGTSSLSVNAAVTHTVAKQSSGLVLFDPLNDVTMSQQQLQAQGRYTYGGDAIAEKAPYSFSEDSNGFHIGVQAPATPAGTYAGFYAADLNFNQGQVFHATITAPSRTIPSGYYNTGLYVQTGNGYIDYIFCGEQTDSLGTYWGVSYATSNNTSTATNNQNLYYDSSPNQALTRSCTIVTNGSNMLKVYVDNVLVYSSTALNLMFARPFQTYLEVESSYSGAVLSGTFTDFYVTTTTSLTISNLPASASSVQLVGRSGNVLMSSPVSGGVAVLDIAGNTFPLSASIVVKDSGGNTIASSSVFALWGGDVYSYQ